MKYIIAGIFLFVLLAGCTSSEGDLLLIDQSGGGGGAGKIYTGLSPVSVDNDANTIRLNVQPSSDWNGLFDGQEGSYYLDRANHTGTQTASTISDFNNNVEAQIEQADHNVLSEWNFNEQLLIAGGFAAGGASIIGGTGFFQNMIIAEDLNVVNVNDFNALGDIIPFVDDAYLLGTSAKRWAEIWGTDINATNIGATNAYLTTAQISGQVNIRDTADPTINAIDTDAGAGSQISTWKYDADTNSWQLQNRNDAGGFIDNAFTFNKVSQTLSTGTRRINLDGNLYIDHGASSRTSVYVEGNETLRVDGSGDVYYGDIGGSGRNAVIRANGANKLSAGNVDLNITDTFRLIDNPASMFLRDTGGGTGLKQWLIRSDDGGLLFAPQNDDGVGTGYWLQLTRDGTNTNRIGSLLVGNFADPLLDVNVTEDRVYVAGDMYVGSGKDTNLFVEPNSSVGSLNPGATTLATILTGRRLGHTIFDIYQNDREDSFALRFDTDFDGVLNTIPFKVQGTTTYVDGQLDVNTTGTTPLELYRTIAAGNVLTKYANPLGTIYAGGCLDADDTAFNIGSQVDSCNNYILSADFFNKSVHIRGANLGVGTSASAPEGLIDARRGSTGNGLIIGQGGYGASVFQQIMTYQGNAPSHVASYGHAIQTNHAAHVPRDNWIGFYVNSGRGRFPTDVNRVMQIKGDQVVNVEGDINALGIMWSLQLLPQQAKVGTITTPARIYGGENNWQLRYDANINENADWQFQVPIEFSNRQTIYLDTIYSMNQANSSKAIVLAASLSCWSVGEGDINTDSFDSNNTKTQTVNNKAGYLNRSRIILTKRDNMATFDLCRLRLFRNGSNASDTAFGDLEVVGMTIWGGNP